MALLTPLLLLAAQPDGWPFYGHDAGGQRFSPLRQINTSNVAKLHMAWISHTGDQNSAPENLPRGQRRIAFEATPLVIDDVLYISTPGNRVVALDAQTGRELWSFNPWNRLPKPKDLHPNRGVAYWGGNAQDGPRVYYGTSDARLIAIDARTGHAVASFGDNGEINLRTGVADRFPQAPYDLSSPPVIFRDLVIIGSEVQEKPGLGPAGDIRAFNAKTGKLVWQFHTVPRPGEAGHETWKDAGWRDRSGTNAWSIMTLDSETGTLFAPIGSPAYDFYGGDRPGENLYGNSLVALDASTGKLLWHYQFVHHDIWDYDPPSPPALITARGRPAVVEVNKTGLVFILDRRTGKPLFPVQERAVPRSDVPGEWTSPTQPVPLQPPPLSRSTMTRADLTTVTPESHRYCAQLFDKLTNKGPFTPWSLQPTLVFPGTLGGGTWSGASYDPSRALLFINTNEVGAIGQLQALPAGSAVRYQRTSPYGAYARFWDEHLWPCQKPPWGLLQAINVNTGELVWRVPLGTVEELEQRGIKNTGTPNIGGSIATAGGLVFIGATTDERFRAFEAATGRELWSAKLPASAYATPATYRTKNGKQFVVIAAGGGGFFSEKTADTLVAFSL